MNTSPRQIILADADSFFASCERVFHPQLAHTPLVVLSNNDGCVVARSAEVKKMGIPEGIAWFKIREQAQRDGIVARSSNYELYASLSSRMMNVMSTFFPHQTVYSIDECFFDIQADTVTLVETSTRMREAVWQGLGLPISIGIAPTHTLAKVVSHWSKHYRGVRGIMTWDEAVSTDSHFLAHVPVGDVWGVGRRLAPQLMAMGILTAQDLRDSDAVLLRKKFGVHIQQTIFELRGISCIRIDDEDNALHGRRTTQIMCSRMFSHPISSASELRQAVSVYTQKALHRLTAQESLCSYVSVFCSTSRFKEQELTSHIHGTVALNEPTNDPLTLTQAACRCIDGQFTVGAAYVRAGVILHGLIDEADYQPLDVFSAHTDTALSDVLEAARQRFGDFRIGVGYGGIRGQGRMDQDTGAHWSMKREHLSARATTRWSEMATVHA